MHKQVWLEHALVTRFVTELGLESSAKIHGAIHKVVTGKNQTERIYALDYLLGKLKESLEEAQASK